jgi:hypothetical protein
MFGLCACQPSEETPHDGAVPPVALDAAASDAAPSLADAAKPDASAPDAAVDAAAPVDASASDAGPDAAPDAAELDPSVPSAFLSETGLYSDAQQKVLAPGVQLYEVRGELWADGATKKRYLFLPAGKQIDTTDPDAWIFPIGTKIWKEFTRDGMRVETRLIEKAGPGKDGWKFVAYAWNSAQTAAEAVPLGRVAALGTAHDVPTQTNCSNCHEGSPDFALGVSAFGLLVDGAGVSLASLVRDGRLTRAITADQVAIPGNAAAQAALGVLHANCGSSCHRPGTFAWEKANIELRLKVGMKSVEQTPIYMSNVGVKVGQIFENVPFRITAGKPAESAVYTRMNSRVEMVGMPNVGTKVVDSAGAKIVSDWIRSLTP